MPARRTSNRDKAIAGTLRPDRIRAEPEYPKVDGYPEPPDWLRDAVAIREWNHKVAILVDANVLTEASLSTLGQYCNMHSAAVEKWDDGKSPTAADLTQLRLMATEFGFTPASRSKAGGGDSGKDGNDFSRFTDPERKAG